MAIKHTYRALERERKRRGEWADCTVRALAVACGVPYATAHRAMREAGRKPKQGALQEEVVQALGSLGYLVFDVRGYFKGRTVRTLERELPPVPMILDMAGHLAAWDGRRIVDHAAGECRRVREIWVLVKVTK